MKFACQYAIVRFMPFVETGEFANVGIVLLCPDARYFGFRLLRRYGRVTRFFEGLEARIYTQAKGTFAEELRTFKALLTKEIFTGNRKELDKNLAMRLFADLIRPREVMMRFDTPRVMLTAKPDQALTELYNFYVERNFVSKEYREQLLEKSVRRLLSTAPIGATYTDRRVGNDEFNVRFPFVHAPDDEPIKVIKPLFLGHEEPNKILSHGGPWVDRIRRLKRRKLLPPEVLFAVAPPTQRYMNRYNAYEEICGDLLDAGVEVARVGEEERIVRFAQVEETTDA